MNWSLVAPLTSIAGFLILLIRFAPILMRGRSSQLLSGEVAETFERVSIIIPARNEEANLPRLLHSLAHLDWPNLEVILVDDESTDTTAIIAKDFARTHPRMNLQVISGRTRPQGWTGKNWACHQGYEKATGTWLLFTDADTQHLPASLRHAVKRMKVEGLDLLSAAPYHRCESLWEKLLGPFHLFMLVSTAAFAEPRKGRLFAIGQYLLFSRTGYERQGGHEAIRNVLCDDLELANCCLDHGGQFRVEGRLQLYRVRMYAKLSEFFTGWRRIFRLGFRHARLTSPIEMYLVIAALTASLKFIGADGLSISLMLLSVFILGLVQKRFGDFSWWGILLFPLSLGVFTWVSATALTDLILNREYTWRGRSYSKTAD